ncbi:MAG: hypothetical protein AAF804_03655 [Bacteroidota bacterium]
MPSIVTFGIMFLLSLSMLAQSGNAGRSYQRTRSLQPTYDLPYLTVDGLSPSTASDQSTLVIYAPDSMNIVLEVEPWMKEGKSIWTRTYRIGPGKQKLHLPFQALSSGDYTLLVTRRKQILGSTSFRIDR